MKKRRYKKWEEGQWRTTLRGPFIADLAQLLRYGVENGVLHEDVELVWRALWIISLAGKKASGINANARCEAMDTIWKVSCRGLKKSIAINDLRKIEEDTWGSP